MAQALTDTVPVRSLPNSSAKTTGLKKTFGKPTPSITNSICCIATPMNDSRCRALSGDQASPRPYTTIPSGAWWGYYRGQSPVCGIGRR
jgi:hypothetical protein